MTHVIFKNEIWRSTHGIKIITAVAGALPIVGEADWFQVLICIREITVVNFIVLTYRIDLRRLAMDSACRTYKVYSIQDCNWLASDWEDEN